MLLNIVTPVTRPENLYVLKACIKDQISPYFSVKWYCIYDPGKNNTVIENDEKWIISKYGGTSNDCGGGTQRNEALTSIESGWVCFLDDDNLFYDGYGKFISQTIKNNQSFSAFVVSQKRLSGDLIAKKEYMKVGHIDIAQVVLSNDIISSSRFFEDVYQSDYFFIKNVYKKNREKFMFIDKFLCNYNFLRK